MYFFRSIILVFLIVISSLMIYQYLVNKKDLKLSKRKLFFIYLVLIQGFFVLFSTDVISLIFLDFSLILGYKLKLRKEVLLLSFINILYLLMILDIPFYFYLVYLVYFSVDYFFNKDDRDIINCLVVIKSFISSYIYFAYFDSNVLGVLYLVFIFSYFYLLLKYSFKFIKEYKCNRKDDNVIFQIAHEVKNPIAVCKGYLDMLDTSKKDKIDKYLPIIKSEMNRALTIMDDFLNLKRLVVNKDIMDLNLLLEDVLVTMNSMLLNKDVKLSINNLDDELIIDGDYDRLKQVFINLIKNSYEANAKEISISTKIKKDEVEVFVVDDGDGINSSDLKKVGQVFYTTKVKGNGIGVSMSKEIVKLHNGRIKYDSKLGEGTKVNITLPYEFTF